MLAGMWPRLFAALLGLLGSACGPKLVSETVFENPRVKVQLRHQERSGESLTHGYAHPAQLEEVRIAHILASLVHEDLNGRRSPTIRSLYVYELAEGLAQAFERATPAQEVVAAAVVRDRRLGLFTIDRVTALRAAVEGEELVIEFFTVEEELEDGGEDDVAESYDIPATLPEDRPDFKLVASEAQLARGPRGVRVYWRDDFYRRPMSLRVRQGRMKRRTVLLEEPSGLGSGTEPGLLAPEELSADQLETAADLLQARQAGRLPEAEYRRLLRQILEKRPEEADAGDSPP